MLKRLAWAPLLLVLFTGCDSPSEKPAENDIQPDKAAAGDLAKTPPLSNTDNHTIVELATSPPALLSQPLAAVLAETPQEAIPAWREAAEKPVLVLLSADPMLNPIPGPLVGSALKLTRTASPEVLRSEGSLSPSPTLMPRQTLRAALKAGLFSRVVWVIPDSTPETPLDGKAIRDRLLDTGTLHPTEATTVKVREHGLEGTVSSTPFTATTIAQLPDVENEVVIHLDLTYFSDLYRNEIKTPLLSLIKNTFVSLKETHWSVAGATITPNNLLGVITLRVRFLAPMLAKVFSEPTLLNQPPPDNWTLLEKALYLENFYQPEKSRDLYVAMIENDPTDPAAHYGLYRNARSLNDQETARMSLLRAIELDPVYGLEFIRLAEESAEGGHLETSAAFLERATQIFPDNLGLKIRLAETWLAIDRKALARELIAELQTAEWSPIYAPEIPSHLADLAERAQTVKRR